MLKTIAALQGGVELEQEQLQEDLRSSSMATGWVRREDLRREDLWLQPWGVQQEVLPESFRDAKLPLEAPLVPSPGR